MEEELFTSVNPQSKALFDYYMENFSPKEKKPKEKSLYEKYKTSNWGLALDAVGAAADIASTVPVLAPIAGPVGAVVDIPITGLALYDGFKNGFTADHFLDMGKMIPFGSIARQGLKSANKTAKYVRRASPYS
jgi:hypothetical protein